MGDFKYGYIVNIYVYFLGYLSYMSNKLLLVVCCMLIVLCL